VLRKTATNRKAEPSDGIGANYRFTAARRNGRLPGSSRHHYVFSIMGNLKKKRRLQMNKHKRRKRLKSNRHKKRTWQK
jgi:hypothetical protein